MTAPRVSVVIPVKNRGDLLARCIDTLIAQTERNWEAIVVDDGSAGDDLKAIRAATARDSRIRFLSRPDGKHPGACACRNVGLGESRAALVMFLDADDALDPRCLEERAACLEHHSLLDFGIFPCRVFRHSPGDDSRMQNAPLSGDPLLRFLRMDVPWQTGSPLWRREFLERMGPWDESLPSAQDWEFHVRALTRRPKYSYFRCGACYWRLPYGDTIGSASLSEPHVAAQDIMYRGTLTLLNDTGLLSAECKAAMGGLFLRSAFRRLQLGDRGGASGSWRAALELGLANPEQHRLGETVLSTARVPVVGHAARALAKRLWPRGLYPEASKTFLKSYPASWDDPSGHVLDLPKADRDSLHLT